jgi:uncharacterized protein with HEPN domain
MQLEAKKLLTDIRDAADSVAQFAAGKTLADFSGDKLLRSAIYFQFVVIGEALTQLRALEKQPRSGSPNIGASSVFATRSSTATPRSTMKLPGASLPINCLFLQQEVTGLLAE